MRGAVLVAIAASIGNLLQGWDNATIAGALLYIKREFNLQSDPTMEGLIVAMSLIGATAITTFSGPVSDSVGRRPMLIVSTVLYFLSGIIMLYSPNIYTLLFARLLDGFGIGLAVTLVPVYISETAPPEIRGLLNTLPQFMGCFGMFLSYCMVFGMSLMDSPSWRLMLGVLSIPSLVYFGLTVLFLPESPRWLVSKGRMDEAKRVLQRLRGQEDVSGEMALLVEGLGVGSGTLVEEYIITPANNVDENQEVNDQIKLYGTDQGVSWIAKSVTGQTNLGPPSRHGSMARQSMSFIDPLVTLFGSIHEKVPDSGSRIFPNFGSMFHAENNQTKHEQWDEESLLRDGDHQPLDPSEAGSDDELRSPLLSRHATNADKDMGPYPTNGSALSMRLYSGIMQQESVRSNSGMDIGGGWQLAYKYSEGKEKEKGGLKRVYLHQDNNTPRVRYGSVSSVTEGDFHASALVSLSTVDQIPVDGEVIKLSQSVAKGSTWVELFEPGVKHALIVGVGLQILQQFSGINGVLYYTPQILEQAGVGVLMSDMGIRPDSVSLLISALTTLLMLPSIGIAMRLMDIAGRRRLLLSTLPILLLSLIVLVFGNIINLSSIAHAIISTISVVVYFCCFVMGFGPIPNILCSEIFPTRVRGLCIAICALVFWTGDIIVTYTLPVMLTSIGLGGVFAIYAVVCGIAWVFVYLKVPETKGMPLEVISEFFALGAKHSVDVTKD